MISLRPLPSEDRPKPLPAIQTFLPSRRCPSRPAASAPSLVFSFLHPSPSNDTQLPCIYCELYICDLSVSIPAILRQLVHCESQHAIPARALPICAKRLTLIYESQLKDECELFPLPPSIPVLPNSIIIKHDPIGFNNCCLPQSALREALY